MPLPLMAVAGGASLLGKLFGGASQGSAQERAGQNQFTLNRNSQDLSKYGTQQNALLSAILARGRDNQDRYQTQQGATTSAMSGLQGATSHALDAQSAEGLNRSQLGMQSASTRARQSILGSLMKNMQPTRIQGPEGQRGHESTITGGMNASALDPTTRQHGAELMKAALMAQMSGSDVPAATDFKSGIQDWKSSILTPPEATDYTSAIIDAPTLGGYKQAGRGESIMSGAGIGGGVLGEILKLIAAGQAPTMDQAEG